jgi:hypothetical protein
MTIETDLRAAADRAHADSLLLHEIVHGDAQTTVITENGLVKSVAKTIVDVEASVAAHMTDITQAVDAADAAQTAAELARDEALDARDAALAAVGTVAVSATDSAPGQLVAKIEAGLGLGATVVDPGGDERLSLDLAPQIHVGALVALARSFI